MADRRMFSKKITSSARFLKMPLSSQALYFHLGQNADDDGVVEAYTVVQTVGAAEDDLRVLCSKGFVQVLNEDLVTYITDWRENNKLRADRKIDSIYKDLLLQMVPDADLLQIQNRADRPPRVPQPLPLGGGPSRGRPVDAHGTAQDRVVEGSLVEDSLIEDSLVEEDESAGKPPPLPPPPPKKTNQPEVVDFGTLSPHVISEVEKWLQYKKERREGYKPTGLKALITQIENNVRRYGEDAVIDLIGECMAANWRGIIFDKLKNQTQPQRQPQQQKSGGDRLLEMIRQGDFDE